MSAAHLIMGVVRRDLLLAFRHRSEMINPLLFFVIVVSLFPLAIGPDVIFLQRIAPGVIWVGALLATLLSLDSLFRSDFEDGSLEQFLLSPQSLSVLVSAKVIAHWLVTGLPIILISPLLAMMLHLSGHVTGVLMITLLLGTPILSLIGAIGIALTVGLRQGGVLLALLILPLVMPVLIFGSGAVIAAGFAMPVGGELSWLGALLILALTLSPLTIAAALRIGVM